MSIRRHFSRPGTTTETITAVKVPEGTFTIGSDRPDESPPAKLPCVASGSAATQ
jgi:hypothetical protein